jgi:predicted Co/Zn/Cd cation transporter (cation efflux family)
LNTEQRILRASIGVTVFVACFGIIFGLLSGSFSIAFDGVYSPTDAIMSVLALIVSKLIASSTAPNGPTGKLRERFTMGFWHLEPIVLGRCPIDHSSVTQAACRQGRTGLCELLWIHILPGLRRKGWKGKAD